MISPSTAWKRFGIGTNILYRIWRDVENIPSVDRKTPVDRVSEVEVEKTLEDVCNILQQIVMQIAENNMLQKENKDIVVDILSRLDTDEEDNIVDKLVGEIEDTKADIEDRIEEDTSVVQKIGAAFGTYNMACNVFPFVFAVVVVA